MAFWIPLFLFLQSSSSASSPAASGPSSSSSSHYYYKRFLICARRDFWGRWEYYNNCVVVVVNRAQNKSAFLSEEEDTRAQHLLLLRFFALSLSKTLSRGGAKTLISVSLLHFFCFGDDDLRTRRCCCLKFSFFSNPKIIWLFQAHAFLKNRHTTKKKDAADTKKTVDEESHINLFDKRSRDEYYPSK